MAAKSQETSNSEETNSQSSEADETSSIKAKDEGAKETKSIKVSGAELIRQFEKGQQKDDLPLADHRG